VKTRRLIVILGDQLDEQSSALRDIDALRDTVLMMEVRAESEHVPSHVQRTVLFLSAMRHFAAGLRDRGLRVRYVNIDDPANTQRFDTELARAIAELSPREIVCVEPGEHRGRELLVPAAAAAGLAIEWRPDEHFFCSPERFAAWAKGRSSLTMEYFYREQRRTTGYLMFDGEPEGGVWNFDKDNRLPFGKDGPTPAPPVPKRFAPDATTREVIDAVRRVFAHETGNPHLPGRLDDPDQFAWPVTRKQALEALDDFIVKRLRLFGPFEDAMWSTTRAVYHSTLSPALNLKLLNPRECCEKAIHAWKRGKAPIESVEAFVRQLIGWREFIRGVYMLEGPQYAERNSLGASGTLPEFYWTGNTDMNCMKQCVGQVLDDGYAHHIQRLMVMGNFALISGVHPRAISDWYLGMFVDGVDWVTLPNTLGMVMHADRRPREPGSEQAQSTNTGVVGTKPYAASGKYIDRMSNYCRGCAYDVKQRTGPRACPFNTFYWDFLLSAAPKLRGNHRMSVVLKGAEKLPASEKVAISLSALALREKFGITPSVIGQDATATPARDAPLQHALFPSERPSTPPAGRRR
jgi:deoxyribodipyrimidine photolyase-related protein